jgi:hypothetical protein
MLWEARKIQDLYRTAKNESKDDSEENSEDEGEDESDRKAIFEPLKAKQPLLDEVLYRVSRFRNSSFSFTGKTNSGTIASLSF